MEEKTLMTTPTMNVVINEHPLKAPKELISTDLAGGGICSQPLSMSHSAHWANMTGEMTSGMELSQINPCISPGQIQIV